MIWPGKMIRFLISAVLLVAIHEPCANANATVKGIAELRQGVWYWRIPSTTHATILRSGEPERQLQVKDVLLDGDIVRTTQAHVRLELESGGDVLILAYSELQVGTSWVEQLLGNVYYHVHSLFEVHHGTVTAGVESTRFHVAVRPNDDFRVLVESGVVDVSDGGEPEPVHPREGVVVALDTPPGLTSPIVSWRVPAADRVGTLQKAWLAGRPRTRLGVSASEEIVLGPLEPGRTGVENTTVDAAAVSGAAVFARTLVSPVIELGLSGGVSFDHTRDVLHFPLTLDVGASFRRWSFAVRGNATGVQCICDDDTIGPVIVYFGGSGVARRTFPMSRQLAVEAEVAVGWIESAAVKGAVGIAFGL
jgi:hypothetical protein